MDHGCKWFDLADLSSNGYLKKNGDKIVVLPFLFQMGISALRAAKFYSFLIS
jgi:hypothetical protein